MYGGARGYQLYNAMLGRRAGVARLVAGVHYRFDVEAGEAIGQGVAALAAAKLVAAKLAPAMR